MQQDPRTDGCLLWRVAKEGRIAEARLSLTADGRELCVIVENRLWSLRSFPDGTGSEAIGADSERNLQNFLDHGWALDVETGTPSG